MSTLPLRPIGYPGISDVAVASQQKALVLIIVLLLMFADIGSEAAANEPYEFFLQVIALLVAGVFCTANR